MKIRYGKDFVTGNMEMEIIYNGVLYGIDKEDIIDRLLELVKDFGTFAKEEQWTSFLLGYIPDHILSQEYINEIKENNFIRE
jgi:hypothetical protein